MYIFTFVCLSIFSWFSVFRRITLSKVGVFFVFFIIWLIFHDGLRWGIGTDWTIYYNYFQNCLFIDTDEFEFGYVVISKFVRSLTSYYTVFLILHAIMVYSTFGYLFKKYSPYPILSLLLFYFSMLNYMGMNRQYVALCILIWSVPFIVERSFIKYSLFQILAFFFHQSSILFVIAYFVPHLKERKFYIKILIAACIISVLGLINKIPFEIFFYFGARFGEKAELFMNDTEGTSLIVVLFGILKRVIWIFLLFNSWKDIKSSRYLSLLFNLYFISILIYVLFNGTILQVMVQRGIVYFSVFEFVLLPLIFLNLKTKQIKVCLFFLLVLYGFWQMDRGMNYYKKLLDCDIYRPYNAIYIDSNYNAHKY